MKSQLPEIRIKDAWLLRENASTHLNELWGEGQPLRTDDEYLEITQNFHKAWQPFEHKILRGMCELLDLNFRQNVIDVYIAPWFHAFSDPIVIGVLHEPDVFVDILTHELLHRLLTDNTIIPHDTQMLDDWKRLFGKQHTFNTLIHIPVHAVHKAIYLDVLQAPERLARDIKNNKDHNATDYVKAWNYVEKHDHQAIIQKLQKSYQKLGSRTSTKLTA